MRGSGDKEKQEESFLPFFWWEMNYEEGEKLKEEKKENEKGVYT